MRRARLLSSLFCIVVLARVADAAFVAQAGVLEPGAAPRALSEAEALRRTMPAGASALVLNVGDDRVLATIGDVRTAQYAPGSTLKPFVLLRALTAGVVQPSTVLPCRGTLMVAGRNIACTHPRALRSFTAETALAYSCNEYFATLAARMHPAELLGSLSDYGVHASGGASALAAPNARVLLALGLAGVRVSAAELAEAYRHLALAVYGGAGKPQRTALELVQRGLEGSATYGMAYAAATPGVRLAGKTGTASEPRQAWTHGWFAGIVYGSRWQAATGDCRPGAAWQRWRRGGAGSSLSRAGTRTVKSLVRAFAATMALACGGAVAAQNSGDVTVRVFSTRDVTAVSLIPEGSGAVLRRCATCKPEPLTASTLVIAGETGVRIGSDSLARVWVDGTLRAQTKDLPSAQAAGKWQIDNVHGRLRVLLTLPRERYVMAVLAREAAADDPAAALQAMAVVVRSFAWVNAGKHRAQGYDFDDSTESQAAVFGALQDRVREAVQATAGETLWVGRARVAAYFSEACGGMTEDAAALWGGAKKPWLLAHADPYCQRTPAKWHAEISADQVRAALNAEGFALLGPVTGMRVLAHTSGGRAAKVEVRSGAQSIPVPAESFRFAVDRALGWNTLRSDWYTMSFSNARAVFEGRGYGHGVGLCQAGARAFALEHPADAATVARAILRFYFAGADVRVQMEDHGWQQREAAGWTLYSVAHDDTLLRDGDAAWRQAQQRFHVDAALHPVVRVFPDTELFRQATSESGWVVGATRGQTIALQPASIVARHGTVQALLLHEFLHVLVESEAVPSTPLWLREGFVEWLADSAGNFEKRPIGQPQHLASKIEAGLVHAATWQEAEDAHRAEGALVAQMIARYGTATVRGWLRSGVPNGVLAR